MHDIRNEEIVLQDDRVLLRPLIATDLENLLPFSLQEPEIWKYSLVSPGGSKEAMDRYIQTTLKERQEGREYPFIVYDKLRDSYAGSTRFYDIQPAHSTVQLGYTWYGKDFQRTGLNRHCKLLLLGFCFEQWGAERVEFRADVNNARSIKAMKDIGCTVEGILRSQLQPQHKPGERRTSIVLSILKEEWFAHVKRRLEKKIQAYAGTV
jgi:N-acetyltransferase